MGSRRSNLWIALIALGVAIIETGVLVYFLKYNFTIQQGVPELKQISAYVFIVSLLWSGIFLVYLFSQLQTATAGGVQGNDSGGKKTGRVKWFSVSKGYGFITSDSGEDIFVHCKSIEGDKRSLFKGQGVYYVEIEDENGLQAIQVRISE